MPMLQIDDETFEAVLVEHLKECARVAVSETREIRHPDDHEYNAKLLSGLLTTIQYFSVPREYEDFVADLFNRANVESNEEQFDFDFEIEEDE